MTLNTGKKFEALVKQSATEQGFDYNRLKDAGFVGDKSESRRFTPKNICDATLFTGNSMLYLELKSRHSSLSLSDITQYADLMKKDQANQVANLHIGLLVQFQNFDEVWYIDVSRVVDALHGKKSFNRNDLIKLDSLLAFKLPYIIPMGKRTARIDLRPLDNLTCSSYK